MKKLFKYIIISCFCLITMNTFSQKKWTLEKCIEYAKEHNVDVIRPNNINNCNQIFARDLGFVISNLFFLSNIVPNRHDELKGIDEILKNLDVGVIKLPEFMHIEGGDVIVHNDKSNLIY